MGSDPEHESIRETTPMKTRGILSLRQNFKKGSDRDTSDAGAGLVKRHPVKKSKSNRQSRYELLTPRNSDRDHYGTSDDLNRDSTVHQHDLHKALNETLKLSSGVFHGMSDSSQNLIALLQISNKPPQNSLGQIVLEYLLKQEARAALVATMNTQSPAARPSIPSFDLKRLEPFSATMHESISDLLKSTGNTYMDCIRRLENLHAVRGKQQITVFKNCVAQKLQASKNLVTLHEFAKNALLGCPTTESTDVVLQCDLPQPAAVSPLELLQRGPDFEDDDETVRDELIGRIRAYRQAVVVRKSQAIQRPADTERLFPCVMQRTAIMALMAASVELQDHDIDFDVTSISDVAKKYEQLHKRRSVSESLMPERRPSKGVQVRKNRSWPAKNDRKHPGPDKDTFHRSSPVKCRDAEGERLEWKRMLCPTLESTLEADEDRLDTCKSLYKNVSTSFD